MQTENNKGSKSKNENNVPAQATEKMKQQNQVILTGFLGRDPKVEEYEGGRKKAFFTLATNQVFRDKTGQMQEETQWHSLVAWGKLADQAANFLRKGDKISVSGRINYRKYTDKNGAEKLFTEIIMQSLSILPKPQPQGAAA